MPGLLRLALHVVIVVVAASSADEEGRGEKGSRAGTNLLDGGNVLGERRGVDEDLLLESANLSAFCSSKRYLGVGRIGQWRCARQDSKKETYWGLRVVILSSFFGPVSGRWTVFAGQCIEVVERPLRSTELDGGPNWSAVIGRLPRSVRLA